MGMIWVGRTFYSALVISYLTLHWYPRQLPLFCRKLILCGLPQIGIILATKQLGKGGGFKGSENVCEKERRVRERGG